MNMRPECIPCLLNRVLFEAKLVNKDLNYLVVEEALKILSEDFREGVNSAKIATKVHKRVYELLENDDPYLALKRMSNDVALSLYPKAQSYVQKADDKFKAAALCSIVGNVLDFGIRSDFDDPKKLIGKFDGLLAQGLAHDDTKEIKEIAQKAQDVLFFTDNCGEIVFDQLLLSELKKFNVHLTLVVKGAPILTDATMYDVKTLQLNKLVDDVATTNGFAVGVDFEKIDKDLQKKLKNADLIICKGMANWESFSDEGYKPIAYFLRTKCDPVANSMQLKKDINAVKLYY
jgi:uncharacterized protein with ATP-grasp and redox domains